MPAQDAVRAGDDRLPPWLAGLSRTWRAGWCRPAINQLWVADITYVRLAEAFVYLAVVLDAFSRRVVGWALADHLRAEPGAGGAAAWRSAAARSSPGGLVHHSDRGVQYACGDYIARARAAGIQPSMSRVGCPYDNAMAESFMKTLKQEEVDGRAYRDLADAQAAIGTFIEEVYNRQRLHSALAYRSPASSRRNLRWPGLLRSSPIRALIATSSAWYFVSHIRGAVQSWSGLEWTPKVRHG